jgi:hypothetical protein
MPNTCFNSSKHSKITEMFPIYLILQYKYGDDKFKYWTVFSRQTRGKKKNLFYALVISSCVACWFRNDTYFFIYLKSSCVRYKKNTYDDNTIK